MYISVTLYFLQNFTLCVFIKSNLNHLSLFTEEMFCVVRSCKQLYFLFCCNYILFKVSTLVEI